MLDAGASARVLGTDIETLLEREARLKGFTDEELASSFTRLVSVSRDSGKAFKELGLAEDVARARHVDVATAALALSRAEQGSLISLSRLGIIIPKVSSAQSELRKHHDELAAAGVKLTKQQDIQYKQSLAVAKAADAQASKTEALRVVQQRFGGTAATFAQQAAGSFATFQQTLHQLEVSIGDALIPGLQRGAEGLTHFFRALTVSGQAHDTVVGFLNATSQALGAIRTVAALALPSVEAIARGLAKVNDVVGLNNIVLFAAGFKTLSFGIALAEAARAKFNVAIGAGTPQEEAATVATQAQAKAVGELAVANDRLAATATTATTAARGETAIVNGLAVSVERLTSALAENAAVSRVDTGVLSTGVLADAATGFSAIGSAANAAAVQASDAGTKTTQAFQAAGEASKTSTAELITHASDAAVLGDTVRHTAKDLTEFEKNAIKSTKAVGDLGTAETAYAAKTADATATQAAQTAQTVKQAAAVDALAPALDRTAAAQERSVAGATAATGANAGLALSSADLGAAAQASGASLLDTSNKLASVAHHSEGLLQNVKDARGSAGAAAGTAAAQTDKLVAAQIRYNTAIEAGFPAERAAAAALETEAGSVDKLTSSLAANTEVRGANVAATDAASTSSGRSAAIAAENAAFAASQPKVPLVGASLLPANDRIRAASLAQDAEWQAMWGRAIDKEELLAASERAAGAAAGVQAGAVDGLTASVAANTEVLIGNSVANADLAASGAEASIAGLSLKARALADGQKILIPVTSASTTALRGLSGAASAVGGAAVTLGGKLRTLASGLFAMAGGVRTLALGGLALLGFAIFKIVTQSTDLESATKRLGGTIGAVGDDLAKASTFAKQYDASLSSEKSDRLAASEAQLGVTRARSALATTDAKSGTLAYSEALLQLKSAVDQNRLAEQRLAEDEKNAAAARRGQAAEFVKLEHDKQVALEATRSLIRAAETQGTGFLGNLGTKIGNFSKSIFGSLQTNENKGLLVGGPNQEQAANRFADSLRKVSDKLAEQHPLLARQVEDFSLIVRSLREIPPDRIVNVFVRTGSARVAIQELIRDQEKLHPSVESFIATLDRERVALNSSDPALAKRLRLIEDLTRLLGRVPTRRETSIILHAGSFNAVLQALVADLQKLPPEAAQKAGFKSASAFVAAFLSGLKGEGIIGSVAAVLTSAAEKAAGVSAAALKSAGDLVRQDKQGLASIESQIRDSRATLATATSTLADAQTTLADAIRNGNQSIHDAIASADQNLFSIGSSLSDLLGQFLDAQQKTGAAADISAAEAKRLRAQIIAGKGGVGTQIAEQELASRAESAQTSGQNADIQKKKDAAKRGIADLIDEFNRGQITLRQLNQGIGKILASDGFTYKRAGKLLGQAFVDGFREQLAGISKQGQAILAVPLKLRAGISGQEPNIVRPEDTIRQVAREIQRDRKQVSADQIAVLKDQKKLQGEQLGEARIGNTLARDQNHLARLQLQEAKALAAARAATPHFSDADVAKIGRAVSAAVRTVGRFVGGGVGSPGPRAEPIPPKLTAQQNAEAARLATDLRKAQTATGREARDLGREIVRLARDLGETLPAGIAAGAEAGRHKALLQASRLIHDYLAELRAASRSHSPSEATREIGRDLGLGLASGVQDASPVSAAAARAAVARAIAEARASLTAAHATITQRVRLVREFAIEGDLAAFVRRAETIPSLRDRRIRQRVTLARTLATVGDLRSLLARADAVPPALPDHTIRQRIRLAREFGESGDLERFLARARAVTPTLPAATIRQRVSLLRDLVERALPIRTLPPTLPAATLRQRVGLLRDVVERPLSISALPRLAPATIRQRVAVLRDVTEQALRTRALPTTLAATTIRQRVAVARTLVDPPIHTRAIGTTLPPVAIRQRVSLLRDLTQQAIRPSAVPSVLPAATIRQRVSILRDVAEQALRARALPATLPAATVRQRVSVLRDVAEQAFRPRALPAILPAATIRQRVAVVRDVADQAPRFRILPTVLPAATVRQRVSVLREVADQAFRVRTLPTALPAAIVRQRVAVLRTLADELPGFRTLPATLPAATVRQRVALLRTLAEQPFRPLPLPATLAPATVRQRIALLRNVATSPLVTPTLPSTLAPATIRQRIALLRSLTEEPLPIRRLPTRLPATTIRQRVALLHELIQNAVAFRPIAPTLPAAFVRQHVEVRRDVADELPRFRTLPARLAPATIRQAIAVARELSPTPPLRPTPLPVSLPAATIRQAVSLVRSLGSQTHVAELLAHAEPIPTLLRRDLRQAIVLRRTLTEDTALPTLLARIAQPPPRIPARTIDGLITIRRTLAGDNLRDLARRATDQTSGVAASLANLPARINLTVATETAARRVGEFLARIRGERIETPVSAQTAPARDQLRQLIEGAHRPVRLPVGAEVRSAEDVLRRFFEREDGHRLSVQVGADTGGAARPLAAFVAREDRRRQIRVGVIAETAAAAREIARVAGSRNISVTAHADSRPAERALATLHAKAVPVALTIPKRPEIVAKPKIAAHEVETLHVQPTRRDTPVGNAIDLQTVRELRSQRSTIAHGNEQLLSEARRQTRVLLELLGSSRRRPEHPKASNAPGEKARAAREAARHNLVP